MKENAEKARSLDNAELHKQVKDTAEQMFRLRFQLSMGQAEGVKKIRSLRKERARMLTILRERQEEGKSEPVPMKSAKAAKSSAKPKKSDAPKAEVRKAEPKSAAKPVKAVNKAAKPSAAKKPAAARPAKTVKG